MQVQDRLGGLFRGNGVSRGVNYESMGLGDPEGGGDEMADEFLSAAPGRTAGQYTRLPGGN